MLEAKYQRQVIKRYESEGYYVIKLIRTNKNGIPDLLCIKHLDNGNNDIIFVEVKGSKTVISPLQEYRIKELNSLGFTAIIDRHL